MRKFNYDENDDYSREVEKFFEDVPNQSSEEESEVEKIIMQSEMQMGLLYREMNLQLLKYAIRIAEKYIFWRFYSIPTRLKYIVAIYQTLKSLEEINDEELEIKEE